MPYRGMITHKGDVHEGKHDAIVDAPLFKRVQQHLDGNARRYRAACDHRIAKAPLMGKLFDVSGEVMSPTFSRGRSGRAYRYYVSASLQQGTPVAGNGAIQRLPAPMIERVIAEAVTRWTRSAEPSLEKVLTVRLGETGLAIDLPGNCAADIAGELADGERLLHATKKICRVHLPLALALRGGRRLIIAGIRPTAQPDAVLISALRRAHRMLERDRRGLPVMEAAPPSPYQRRLIRLALLAPDIQRDILNGRQPPVLNLDRLMKTLIPLTWSKQRAALGWHTTEPPCYDD